MRRREGAVAGVSTFSTSGPSVAVRGGVQLRLCRFELDVRFFSLSREKRAGGPLRGGAGRDSARRCRCELDVRFFFFSREKRAGGPSVAVRGGVQLGDVAASSVSAFFLAREASWGAFARGMKKRAGGHLQPPPRYHKRSRVTALRGVFVEQRGQADPSRAVRVGTAGLHA